MRRLGRLLVAVPMLTVALTGCDAINTASDTLDRAEVCTRALSTAGYTPDLSNPEQSVEDARSKSEELRELAERTSDANLQRELQEMADRLGTLQVSDVNPVSAAQWGADTVRQLDQLRQACS